MIEHWDDLNYWSTGEWQVVQERLDDAKLAGDTVIPDPSKLFAVLDQCDFQSTRVLICGLDPYPEHRYATGVAFSIPVGQTTYPPTLRNIFCEYERDLGLPWPRTGNLEKWVKQGVLLWNVYPAHIKGKHGFHEWEYLTEEIIRELSKKGIVFVFLGRKAQSFKDEVAPLSENTLFNNVVLEYSHPSPLGVKKGGQPFEGSRIFSTINAKLVEQACEPINWKL
jgi:uracil-DNA glycosylase